MKRCPACGETKPKSEFVRNRSTSDGIGAYCRPCHNRIMKKGAERLYGSHANYLLRLRYGLTREDVQRLLDDQGGACAICGKANPRHVDHDHTTRRVRGVLCFSCNGAIGQFGDCPDKLRQALAYLAGFQGNNEANN